MNQRKKTVLFAALFVLLLLSSLNTHSQVWKSDEERLLDGDVLITFKEVPDTLVNEVQAKIYFDAPPQMVWEALTDYDKYSDLFNDINTCNIISQNNDQAKLKITINNLWPYPDFKYKLDVVEDDKNYKMSWKMDEGNLRMLSGSATLEKFPEDKETTCLTYSMVRDPGWIMPLFINPTLSNRAVIIDRLLALRREIREKKAELEGNEKEIKPKWEKALFWWQKDKDKEKKKPSKDKKNKEEKETD